MLSTGLCHSDLNYESRVYKIPIAWPAILGHEGAGVVVKLGEGIKNFQIGDRVLLNFNYCGECKNCLRKHPAICKSTSSGSFDFVESFD